MPRRKNLRLKLCVVSHKSSIPSICGHDAGFCRQNLASWQIRNIGTAPLTNKEAYLHVLIYFSRKKLQEIKFCVSLQSNSNMVPLVQLVRASDCGSECHGFESHRAPQKSSGQKSGTLFFALYVRTQGSSSACRLSVSERIP